MKLTINHIAILKKMGFTLKLSECKINGDLTTNHFIIIDDDNSDKKTSETNFYNEEDLIEEIIGIFESEFEYGYFENDYDYYINKLKTK